MSSLSLPPSCRRDCADDRRRVQGSVSTKDDVRKIVEEIKKKESKVGPPVSLRGRLELINNAAVQRAWKDPITAHNDRTCNLLTVCLGVDGRSS